MVSIPLQVRHEKTEGNRVKMNCGTEYFTNNELLVDWCFIYVYLKILYITIIKYVCIKNIWILDCITFVVSSYILHTIVCIYLWKLRRKTKTTGQRGGKTSCSFQTRCRFSVLLWRCSLVPTTFHTRHRAPVKPKLDWSWEIGGKTLGMGAPG